eukprot:365532-Chlamydomonas_euryale.AAC.7
MAGERSGSNSAADSDSTAAPKRAQPGGRPCFPVCSRKTLDIDALISQHVAATEQPRDDHGLRAKADIAAATRGGVWLAPPPLAPEPVPATALPIVSPLLGGVSPDQVALATALAKAAADLKLPVRDPRVMVMALTHITCP